MVQKPLVTNPEKQYKSSFNCLKTCTDPSSSESVKAGWSLLIDYLSTTDLFTRSSTSGTDPDSNERLIEVRRTSTLGPKRMKPTLSI